MRSHRRLLPLVAVVLVALLAGALPSSAAPRADAVHSEHYFPMGSSGLDALTMLHADVLRPADLGPDVATPVILSVSPYTNHAGVPTVNFDPNGEGPSDRFYDFLDLSDALERGYTYVMVDLPGFGGSGGCNDWGGRREQQAVFAAVEWAASQPWSTGKVGLLGKSYDGWTGLMGIARQPEGLAAVVSLEPVFSGYRYGYMNGVRFLNSVATPALFTAFDLQPGSLQNDPQYHANSAPQLWCYGVNLGLQQIDEESDPFWVERNLLLTTEEKTTPLFLTQGFLESNTKPDGAFDYFNGLAGTQNRAWFGQFDHCRAWETQRRCNDPGDDGPGPLAVGRAGFIDEVMRFLDEHLKGVAPAVEDPSVAVQDALGRYRAEAQWPPADMALHKTELRTGTYADDGENEGTGSSAGQGVWTISQPLEHDAWLAGEPLVDVKVTTTAPRANLVANVYDIDEDGFATLISRGAYLLRDLGEQKAEFELYGQDWPLAAGHRIGVLVSGANAEWFVHVPTGTDVDITAAEVHLPFLTEARSDFLDGEATPELEQHRARAFPVPPATIDAAETAFDVPPLQ